ncbi:uncharacterized protein KY384_000675 [Bacidia gigantensis]|uniref:uncharacterized protein n=1 Tax=Bacidia gigantensis TaxID=2732470 RepID=UPI001D03DC46|nr:uncharacterized protein KY384_000675 [Bacidia gigantensis]KAG8525913.1 hypothetical protein KY384_000675 [Bacidia gigantensis]
MTLFGYDQGVFGGVVVTDDYLVVHNLKGPEHSDILGTITAIYDVGCFFGAIAAFSLGERLGRRNSVLLGTTVMSIGAILQICSYSRGQMIAGRIIAGLGNGMNTATAPVWQAETSQAHWRGKLIVIELILNIAGFSLSNWVTYGFSFVNGPVSWRLPLAFQFIFIFVLFATVPWLPESPRWLIAHGHIDEADQIIADLEAKDVMDPFVITESKEIQKAAEYEREHGVSWIDLIKGKSAPGTCTIRRLLLGGGAQAMQQLAGINVTSYYLPTVLIQSVKLDEKLARLLAACNSRWGRRKMMIYAATGQAVSYALITALLRYSEKEGYPHQKEVASASITFFFTYYIFFGIGFQGVPWLYPTEINSLAMRTKGAAVGTACNWIFNFMGIKTLGWKFYIIWTVFNTSFIPIVYLFYPETAGRTLEDIDRFFRENNNILVFTDKTATQSTRPQAYVEYQQGEIRRNSSVISADPRAMEKMRQRVADANKDIDAEEKETGGYLRKEIS